jgi:hypothetical protein
LIQQFDQNMDIRCFESLIIVAELGSIARAARAQNLTAAAVGQRIAILEQHYDTELLSPGFCSARFVSSQRKLRS